MEHAKSCEVVQFVRPAVGDMDDVMGINPFCLIASLTIFVDVRALALVTPCDSVFCRGWDGFSFGE